jgi:hypothetical protein
VTKAADSKGRIALGPHFANRTVILEAVSETELHIKLARVVPEQEAWLYENPDALNSVRTGLAQAKGGKFSKGPTLGADAKLLAQIEE